MYFVFGDEKMQELIQKIIEVDREAQSITDKVKSAQKEIDKSIFDQRQKMRDDYIKRAKNRIDKIDEQEKKSADEVILATKDKFNDIIEKLDAEYANNHNRWAEEIFHNVTGR
jgi:Sec-independent protein translocase protein TatA